MNEWWMDGRKDGWVEEETSLVGLNPEEEL